MDRRTRMNLLGAALFVVAVVACEYLRRLAGMTGPAAVAFAVPPAMALAWWFWIYVKGIGALDELQQAIEVRALAIGGAVAVWLATSASFVTNLTGLPDIPIYLIAPLIAVSYRIAKWAVERTYQ